MKFALPIILASVMAMPAAATTLRITVTNETGALGSGGFALTPVYTAFHDGSFTAFEEGQAASRGVETIAEVGVIGPVMGERVAATTDSNGVVNSQGQIFSPITDPTTNPPGRRPLSAGESDTVEVTIDDPTDRRFFTFLSMVIPTNDLFIGSEGQGIELFNMAGDFIGPSLLNITGADIYDAGTEVNQVLRDVNGDLLESGIAFAAGQSGNLGEEETGAGVIAQDGFAELAQFLGLSTVAGFDIADTQGLLGGISAADFSVASISFEVVAPVPLPAGGLMLLSAMGLGGFAARRRKQRAA